MRRLSNFLLRLGVVLGLGWALALTFGDRQSSLLAQLLDLSTSVLTFVAAGCAFIAGALLRRSAAKNEASDRAERERLQLFAGAALQDLKPSQTDRARANSYRTHS